MNCCTYSGSFVCTYEPPTFSTKTAIHVNKTLEVFNDYLISQKNYRGRLVKPADVFVRIYKVMADTGWSMDKSAEYVRKVAIKFVEKKRRGNNEKL